MLTKVVIVFLILMAALAVFGRLRFPGAFRRKPSGPRFARTCKTCGRLQTSQGGCDCAGSPLQGK